MCVCERASEGGEGERERGAREREGGGLVGGMEERGKGRWREGGMEVGSEGGGGERARENERGRQREIETIGIIVIKNCEGGRREELRQPYMFMYVCACVCVCVCVCVQIDICIYQYNIDR